MNRETGLNNEILEPIANGPTAKWSYTSLIFSMFYFFPIIFAPSQFEWSQIASVVLVYMVFVSLFVQATRRHGKTALFPILSIVLVAAAVSSINSGANALYGYAAFFTGYYFGFRFAAALVAINVLMQFLAAYSFDLFHAYYLGPSMAVSLSLFVYGRFSRKEQIHFQQQKQKSQQIEQLAAIAERERIARDMHDLLGHSLSSLALKSELAEKLIEKGKFEMAQQEISQVAQIARETLSEVRSAVTGLKQKGLHATLEKLVEQLKQLGFNTQLYIELPELDAKTESTLIMLCKEWITNILRHSDGNSVSISLTVEQERLRLHIGDNGSCQEIKPGNGIEGMKSRVSELSGNLSFKMENGVKLRVDMPFQITE